jgi:hypothetical protein
MIRVKIKKIKNIPEGKFQDGLEVGYTMEDKIKEHFYLNPTVGKRFWVNIKWHTQVIEKILSKNTFQTSSSIFQWEIEHLKDKK